MIKVVGAALIFSVLAYVLRELGWRAAPIFASVASVVILGEVVNMLSDISDGLSFLFEYGIDEAFGAALKIVGLTYVFGISSDICRGIGEKEIAKSVDVAGRVTVIMIVLPFFEEIIEIGIGLIK